MLTHRPVTEADLAVLCALPRTAEELFHCFPRASFPLTEDQLRAAIDQRAASTVVELDGRVVGFANFYQWAEGGTCAIGNVMVASEVRRRGVASYLMRTLCALAFDKYRASEVKVSCFNANTAGLLLYPRLGFVPYAIEERQDKSGERVALIHLRLPRDSASHP
ncbi:MAG TPA: GNAT family N-acetyltransferase [Pseudomonas sp.]|nr:GNAT family N-acetyltransferase [Pseudomonas sp.]